MNDKGLLHLIFITSRENGLFDYLIIKLLMLYNKHQNMKSSLNDEYISVELIQILSILFKVFFVINASKIKTYYQSSAKYSITVNDKHSNFKSIIIQSLAIIGISSSIFIDINKLSSNLYRILISNLHFLSTSILLFDLPSTTIGVNLIISELFSTMTMSLSNNFSEIQNNNNFYTNIFSNFSITILVLYKLFKLAINTKHSIELNNIIKSFLISLISIYFLIVINLFFNNIQKILFNKYFIENIQDNDLISTNIYYGYDKFLNEFIIYNLPILLYWIILIVSSVKIFDYTSSYFKLKKIIKRKLFHLLALLIFIPGFIYIKDDVMLGISVIVFDLFIIMEIMRTSFPIKFKLISDYLKSNIDERDNSSFIITHSFLLLGCFITFLMHFIENKDSDFHKEKNTKLFKFLGLFILGVGDSAASICGINFGKTKIYYPTNKSAEGTIGAIIITLISFVLLDFSLLNLKCKLKLKT